MLTAKAKRRRETEQAGQGSSYASRYMRDPLSKHALPSTGIDARTTQRIILDELSLDGNPALSTASFVTTGWSPKPTSCC